MLNLHCTRKMGLLVCKHLFLRRKNVQAQFVFHQANSRGNVCSVFQLFFSEAECGDEIVRLAPLQKLPSHCCINLTLEAWNRECWKQTKPHQYKRVGKDIFEGIVPWVSDIGYSKNITKCEKKNSCAKFLNFSNFPKYIFCESGGISRGSAASDNEIFARNSRCSILSPPSSLTVRHNSR